MILGKRIILLVIPIALSVMVVPSRNLLPSRLAISGACADNTA
jgi:hypothetical protein